MKKSGRYDISGLIEAQFEPGSRGRVLRNLLGIKSKREMDELERKEQFRLIEELTDIYDRSHSFTAADICTMHKLWLGRIYQWAGKYRQVNISKGDFHFAASAHISKLMDAFEKELLRKYTPCRFDSEEQIVSALAIVHTELILIHPFREGNGRIARILSALMALQAGLPPLDFSRITGRKKVEYISAIQEGMSCNYVPMEKIFRYIIRRTLRIHEQQ